MNYDKIGNFIAIKRKEKGLTQKDLAIKLGVTDKAVSKWERGLGCPDVSILEILSKELDVSILEILKGRIIEDEIIKVTDMNDYVSETIAYSDIKSKEKIKMLLSKILIILILFIGSFLIVLNINHIIYLNKEYEYNFDNYNIKRLHETIDKIDHNIDIIKNNQGTFALEDYQKIVNYLDNSFEFYKNIPILKYNGTKKFNINDIYILDLGMPSKLNVLSIIKILESYNPKVFNYTNLYVDTAMLTAYNDMYSEPIRTYNYQMMTFTDYIGKNIDVYKINQRIYHYIYLIDSYYYLTELIMEVGGIDE